MEYGVQTRPELPRLVLRVGNELLEIVPSRVRDEFLNQPSLVFIGCKIGQRFGFPISRFQTRPVCFFPFDLWRDERFCGTIRDSNFLQWSMCI